MQINPYIFRGYDIRGVIDEDLTKETVRHIGKAFATLLKRKSVGRAVVGRDCRATGKEYGDIMIEELNNAGIDTFDIGMELVGTFYWSQYHLDCQGGVYVSASHNPVNYNGFKLANGFSETLVSEEIQELRKMTEKEDYEKAEEKGKNKKTNIRQAYTEDIIKRISVSGKFKIVVDPSCSTAGGIVPDLLRKAGMDVVENNCNVDSSFPMGTPDPTSGEVAERLREKVLESGADMGFSYDADGDRIGIVDERGNIVWNDVLVALFAIDVLRKNPEATIMYNTLCSKVVEETIKNYSGKSFMWRTGHSFLKKKNQEVKADFIGELSGHFFFSADFYNHDDGIYSTMRLLNYLAETGKTLSEVIEKLPKYISSPEIKVYCADDKKVELIEKISKVLKSDFPDAEIIDDERAGDGVRVDFKDAMFVIRYSQNAPYLTVKFEGKTQERYDFFKKYIGKLLREYQEVDWNSDINVNTNTLD